MAKSDQIRPSAVRVLCRILNVVLRGALPTLAPGCLPVMPPLDKLHVCSPALSCTTHHHQLRCLLTRQLLMS